MKGTQESGVGRVTTFLFTDIEGSTRLWEAYPAEMSSALRHHDEVVRAAIESNAGLVFKTVGDAFCAAFASPSSAIAAAFSAQHALLHAQWPVDSTIRVRMAIHTGECERRDNDFFGPTVNRVARLLAIGHGGQTLVSGVTADLVTDRLAGGASLMALGEHRLKDLERSERVFQLNVPGLETIFPALLSLNNSALRHNLSIQPSSFVGRQRQIAEIRDLVTRAPLTTLTGPGGTGKTRLAMQVAAELLDGSADGVWFVDLASVTDSTGLATAVAAVFGVREEIHRRTANKIIEHLRDRELLLVLDNCEHLINDVARFAADILRSCGKVAILTTSREPLQIDGEHLYRVPPLTVPPRGSNKDDEVYDSEAAQLFLERARQHDRDFGLRAGEVPLIAQVCQRLDGIPLAMELAAARLRTMSLADLHQRLDDLFSLLNAGSRAALPRHQTLRAVIDWSYESLSRSEQIALQRLSVFPSSWTLTAARDVIVGGEVDQANFDGLHDALVLKSLVQLQDSTSGSRYRLLDTVRVYADERLCEMGPQSAVGVRRRYVECCRALAATEEPGGNRRPERLEVLNDDLDNLRTALGFSIELDLTDPGLTIVHALLNVTFRPALLSDLDLLLERAGPPWSALHVDTMLWHTYVMSSSNRSVRPKYLDQALAIAESLDDSTRIAYCLAAMASEHLRTGDVIAQLSVANSAVEAALTSANKAAQRHCLAIRGEAHMQLSDWERAGADFSRAIELAIEDSNILGVRHNQSQLAVACCAAEQFEMAQGFAALVLSTTGPPADDGGASVNALLVLAEIHLHHRQPSEALAVLQAAARDATRRESAIDASLALIAAARPISATGDLQTAAIMLGAGDATAADIGFRLLIPDSLWRSRNEAHLLAMLGTYEFDRLHRYGGSVAPAERVQLLLDYEPDSLP